MALSLTPELPGLTRKLAEDPHYCREDTLLLPFSSVGIQHERCNLTKTCIRGGTYTVMDDTQSMMAATARHMNLRAQAHLTDIDALVHRVLKLSASNETISRSAKEFATKDVQVSSTWQALKSVRNSTARMTEQQDRLQGVTEKVDTLIESTVQILDSNK